MELVEILKALADNNRLRILNLLGDRTLCVCDLEDVLKINQSNLSRHLAKLKQAGLVSAKKKGLFMYYTRTPVPSYEAVIQSLYGTMEREHCWDDDLQELASRSCCSGSST